MGIPTPHSGFRAAIKRWEGAEGVYPVGHKWAGLPRAWQHWPNDKGNWVTCGGQRRLIGTMWGVTPAAYARYRGIDPCTLTAARMQAEITVDVAADIGVANYYIAPGFGRLTYNPLVEIAADIGWGSGPSRGIRMLQAVIGGIAVDGVIGPQTTGAHERFIETADIEDAVLDLYEIRDAFYIRISDPERYPGNATFRDGWRRRAAWYRPDNMGWWGKWEDYLLEDEPEPVGSRLTLARPHDPDPVDGQAGGPVPELLHAFSGDPIVVQNPEGSDG